MDICGRGIGVLPIGGETGIRTLGGSHLNGFQDRRIRPLCHLSVNVAFTRFSPRTQAQNRKKVKKTPQRGEIGGLAVCFLWNLPYNMAKGGDYERD